MPPVIALLDLFSEAGPIGLAVGIGFFLVFAAAAYIAFRVLRKTVKMAFRMSIVAILLLVALAGTIAIFWASSGRSTRQRPVPARSR